MTIVLLQLTLARLLSQTPVSPSVAQSPDAILSRQGPIPPLDPRLKPLPVQGTTATSGVALPPPPQGGPIGVITADEAARIALRLQPNIGIAQAGITVQKGLTRQIKSALFPQLTTLAGYTRLQTLSGTTADATGSPKVMTLVGGSTTIQTSFAFEATLSQLVFDFNHVLNLVRQSAALENAAAQNLSAVQSDTVLAVKQAYYVLSQQISQVQVYELEVANRQSQLDLARSRYNVGLGIPSDVVTAETAKSEAIVSLSQAQGAEVQARITLAELMGLDPRTPISPASLDSATLDVPLIASSDLTPPTSAATGVPLGGRSRPYGALSAGGEGRAGWTPGPNLRRKATPNEFAETSPTAPSLDDLTLTALKQRPEVLRARQTLRSAQFGLSAARTENAPAVSVGASAVSTGDQIFPQQNDLTLGISIAWTPLDGGLAHGLVESARGNLAIAQKQLFAAQQSVKSDVAMAFVNLSTAQQQIPAITAGVTNAELGVRIATGRYSTGIGLFLDIINAQAFLLTARTNLVNNQSAIEQYRAALAHAIAAPLP